MTSWTLNQVQGDGVRMRQFSKTGSSARQGPLRRLFVPVLPCDKLSGVERAPFVYILASGFRGTLYIGVTSDLMRRIWEHRNDLRKGFTASYGVHRLVHLEDFADMYSAISREKQLKRWHRQWKINLIEEKNPHWDDLAPAFGFEPLPAPVRPTTS